MKFSYSLFAFCMFLLCHSVLAKEDQQECDRELVAETLGKKLKMNLKSDAESKHQEWRELTLVCKKQPNNPKHTIAAAFAVSEKATTCPKAEDYLFTVAIIDSTKKRVSSVYSAQYEAAIDATTRIDESSLKIDTARYDVAKGIRAIGIRVNTFFGRCSYEGGWGDELWLFVDKKPVLQPVLQGLTMERYGYQAMQGSFCGGTDELISVVHTAKLSISVSNQWNQDYRDLNIHAHFSSKTENLEATLRDERKLIGQLKFDGEQYQHGFLHELISKQFEKRERVYEANYKRAAQKK